MTPKQARVVNSELLNTIELRIRHLQGQILNDHVTPEKLVKYRIQYDLLQELFNYTKNSGKRV